MSDNRDHYYLRDAMGGHLGLIVDDDGDVSTPGHTAFTTYDAFGNAMTERTAAAGAFAWRGGEGSVTEREPDLVYMQARHYSPKIGRFIQADTNLVGSTTTQGMNRYAYAENDAVNFTDTTGGFLWPIIAAIVAAVALLAWSLFKSIIKSSILRRFGAKVSPCTLRSVLGDFLGELIGLAIGGPGLLGIAGYALIVLGGMISRFPFGFLIGWIPSLLGAILVGIDRGLDALTGSIVDWVYDSIVSDASGGRHMRDDPSNTRTRIADYGSERKIPGWADPGARRRNAWGDQPLAMA